MDLKKITSKIDRSLGGLASQFEFLEGLFIEHDNLQRQRSSINNKFNNLNEDSVRKAKGLPVIKYFAIILETMLAFRGFEFLFIRVIEIQDIPRWAIFIISFIASILIIEGSFRLMFYIKDITGSSISKLVAIIPLLIVPGSNIFAYFYDETSNKGIFLFLAVITFAINLTVIYLLSSLMYKEEYSPKYIRAFNDLKKLDKREKKIQIKFARRYRIIKSESMTLFNYYKQIPNSQDYNINFSQDYLWIIQNEIFKNKQIDFGKNIEEVEDVETGFINWWRKMSHRI